MYDPSTGTWSTAVVALNQCPIGPAKATGPRQTDSTATRTPCHRGQVTAPASRTSVEMYGSQHQHLGQRGETP